MTEEQALDALSRPAGSPSVVVDADAVAVELQKLLLSQPGPSSNVGGAPTDATNQKHLVDDLLEDEEEAGGTTATTRKGREEDPAIKRFRTHIDLLKEQSRQGIAEKERIVAARAVIQRRIAERIQRMYAPSGEDVGRPMCAALVKSAVDRRVQVRRMELELLRLRRLAQERIRNRCCGVGLKGKQRELEQLRARSERLSEECYELVDRCRGEMAALAPATALGGAAIAFNDLAITRKMTQLEQLQRRYAELRKLVAQRALATRIPLNPTSASAM